MKAARVIRRSSSLALLLAACLCCATPLVSLAQPQRGSQTSALINQQLDQPTPLKFSNTPLPQILQSIEDQTGVPIHVADDVYAILPWGAQTPLTLESRLSLRDSLNLIVEKLGLRLDLRSEWLEISPNAALRRIGRRATLQELQTLDLLSHQPLGIDAASPTLADLSRAIDQRLMQATATPTGSTTRPAHNVIVEFRPVEDVDPTKVTVMLQRGATLADALDAIAAQTKMTWYPWGDSVVILAKRAVIRSMLERHVSLSYNGVDIAQVLTDLANRTGVDFSIEPGAIQRVTPEFRIIRLTADASVRQALESLQGYTGLGYVITDDGVYIWNQNSTPAPGTVGSRPRPIAMVQVADGTLALVYDDQLSKNARDAIKAKRDAAISRLEGDLTGIVGPTTRPATQEEPASN